MKLHFLPFAFAKWKKSKTSLKKRIIEFIIITTLIIIIVYVLGGYQVMLDEAIGIIASLSALFIFDLLRLLWFVIVSPVELLNKKNEEIRIKDIEIKKWEKPIKANIKIITKQQDRFRVGLMVINEEGLDIDNCTCSLKSVSFAKFGETLSDVKEELNPAGQNFTWSLGQGERVIIDRNKGGKLVNLASSKDNNLIFNFINSTAYSIQGYYQIEIAINGDINGIPIEEEVWCGYIWLQKFRSMNNRLYYHNQHELIALPADVKIDGINTENIGNTRYFIINNGELPEEGKVYKK